jgi:hypothetical protein
MQVAATVTPRRHDADSTVLDMRGQRRAASSAADVGGDVGCTHEIPVRVVLAIRAAKPSGARFGNPTPAGNARRRGASLVHEPHLDAGESRLVEEGLRQMCAAPLTKPPILPCPDVATGTQQSIAAIGLARGDTQPDRCGAVYPKLGGGSGGHGELMFDLPDDKSSLP